MASGFLPFAVRRRGGWNHLPFLPFPRRAQRPFAVRRRGGWNSRTAVVGYPHVMAGVDGRGEWRGPPGGFPGCRPGAIAGSSSSFRSPPPSSGTGRSPLYLIDAARVTMPVEHSSAAAGRPTALGSKGLLSSGGSGRPCAKTRMV